MEALFEPERGFCGRQASAESPPGRPKYFYEAEMRASADDLCIARVCQFVHVHAFSRLYGEDFCQYEQDEGFGSVVFFDFG